MQGSRFSRVVAGATLLAAGAAIGFFASRHAGLAAKAWSTAASAVASLTAPPAPPPPPAPEATSPAPAPVAAVHRQAAPLSSAQLGAPLVHGAFVTACDAPDDMKVVVDVTVKGGRATHVAVDTRPANAAVASCVERAVRELRWDVSPKTGHVTATY